MKSPVRKRPQRTHARKNRLKTFRKRFVEYFSEGLPPHPGPAVPDCSDGPGAQSGTEPGHAVGALKLVEDSAAGQSAVADGPIEVVP